jgi:hypothetical protein
MNRLLLIVGILCFSTVASAKPISANACNSIPIDPSLYYTFGVSPTSLTERSDDSVITDLNNSPAKGVLRRVAIVRTLIWNSLAYRLDGPGPSEGHITTGGKWRTGKVSHPTLNYSYQVVHWQDLDDSSFTAYFKGSKLCELYYEN